MLSLTLVLAVLAGAGGGAAWGYRTALHVALGKIDPPLPREPRSAAAPQSRQLAQVQF